LLGRHGEIGIEDDQDVAARGLEGGEHRVALALARLPHRLLGNNISRPLFRRWTGNW